VRDCWLRRVGCRSGTVSGMCVVATTAMVLDGWPHAGSRRRWFR